jgi:hypothetical protein
MDVSEPRGVRRLRRHESTVDIARLPGFSPGARDTGSGEEDAQMLRAMIALTRRAKADAGQDEVRVDPDLAALRGGLAE